MLGLSPSFYHVIQPSEYHCPSFPLDDVLFLLENEIYNIIFSSQRVALETVKQTAHACSVDCLVPLR